MALSPTDAKALLKTRGLRATAPRLAVLQAIAAQSSPISHSQLLKLLPTGALDGATVYRNLTRLSEQGILSVVSRAGGMARYALAHGAEESPHHHPHFVCSDCDQIRCLPQGEIPLPAVDGPWADAVARATLQLQGRCPDCLSSAG